MILAIDPGPEQSAFVILRDDGTPENADILPNDVLLHRITRINADHLAIEMVASYGMAVGREVFETCVWIGRFIQAWEKDYTQVYRKDVKLHLCQNMRARDANIRQALIDKFGGKDKAIGKKANPGPLYQFRADMWAALAVAIVWAENNIVREAM